ncbi:MAG: hypothetical protein A2W91_16220 [Bacteroidetes bacterium GWF2_38_335]|nr:MAG: hypothetical protein A2W91_16220 [Bacteroidetes bacterium GWF2_38_335]OFY81235.1 MAG: hypothetical protein A2281_07195 [Bacteroidetes bacterium RIFOXYA12_FULL_38_20]HBS85352.1 transporter [Bacteroidales bacterium]
MNSDLLNIVNRFESISLKQADKVKLFNRTDTKFLFNISQLPELLEKVIDKYNILEIENTRILEYRTLYYDTPEKLMYLAHHNGRLNRYKIRQREYLISGTSFLEIKFKSNKNRTIKKRVKLPAFNPVLDQATANFIADNSCFSCGALVPAISNRFSRISFAHKSKSERLTIDFELSFEDNNGNQVKLDNIVVAEVKQEGYSLKADMIQALRSMHIRESGMSKYCIGTALLDSSVKRNTFKEKLMLINKI